MLPVPVQQAMELILDNDIRKIWDPNMMINKSIKILGENTWIVYSKTKKIAVVSSRDMFQLVHKRLIEADKSK